MSGGTSRLSIRHRSREEIIELFRTCAAKLNRAPGKAEFDRSANLLTASALTRLVEDSIRNRSKFSLGDFERQLFAHKVIVT